MGIITARFYGLGREGLIRIQSRQSACQVHLFHRKDEATTECNRFGKKGKVFCEKRVVD